MKTHTSQGYRRAMAASITKHTVMQHLGIDDLMYGKMQYTAGLDYLAHIVKDQFHEDAISRSRLFWNWWRNHWHLRDEQYLVMVKLSKWEVSESVGLHHNGDTLSDAAKYLLLNSPLELSRDIHPNAVILRDSYAYVIGRITNEHR